MNTLIAIRLDESLDKELDKKATAFGVSKSKLVRDALMDYLPKAKAPAKVAKVEKPAAKKTAKAAKAVKVVKPAVKKTVKSSKPITKKAAKGKKK